LNFKILTVEQFFAQKMKNLKRLISIEGEDEVVRGEVWRLAFDVGSGEVKVML
jgi:hypothetical protein